MRTSSHARRPWRNRGWPLGPCQRAKLPSMATPTSNRVSRRSSARATTSRSSSATAKTATTAMPTSCGAWASFADRSELVRGSQKSARQALDLLHAHPASHATRLAKVAMSTGESAPGPFEDQFFKLSVDLLCVAGPDGYFKRLNPAWEKTLGFTLDELLARQAIDVVHPADRGVTQTELRARLGSGVEVAHFQNRYLCKDGSVRWIEWTCSAVRAGFVYAAGRDVTEQR